MADSLNALCVPPLKVYPSLQGFNYDFLTFQMTDGPEGSPFRDHSQNLERSSPLFYQQLVYISSQVFHKELSIIRMRVNFSLRFLEVPVCCVTLDSWISLDRVAPYY